MFQKRSLLIAVFILCANMFTVNASTYLYDQLMPQLLKNVNVENPTDSDQDLINACRAVSNFGTKYPEVPSETLQAINSIDMIRILSMYARNSTVFGHIGLATKIAQMTDDFEILSNKQALIKYFELNPELAEHLIKVLQLLTKAESKFLALFKQISEQEEINQQAENAKLYFSTPELAKFNEQKYTLEAVTRSKYAMPVLSLIAIMAGPIIFDTLSDQSSDSFGAKVSNATYNNIVNLPSLPNKYVQMFSPMLGETGAILYTALILGANGYSAYQSIRDIKENLDLIYKKQKDLIVAGYLIKSIQKISNAISKDSVLTKLMSYEHAKLSELFDPNSTKTSADLKYLISELLSPSFEGSESYLFSQQGKILATHHLLKRIKGELVPYLEAFGQVDANLAVFTLYQEFKDHPRVTFCLPEFVDGQTPVLEAQEYWHPLIDADKVITNSLDMNAHQAPNLIITGPNAGGKTTSLMSLIINIIFAQSFGIAPSSSLRITPFAKIHSYLDITTDLQAGLSLFAAEVDRAKKLKASIMSCRPGQKTFAIIDEIFSGTDPKVASDVGFKFASQLGDAVHSMTIITTHFPALTELAAKTKRYVNYKVADAVVSADGTITYPFKLVKGISTQNIAAQMLENEGLI